MPHVVFEEAFEEEAVVRGVFLAEARPFVVEEFAFVGSVPGFVVFFAYAVFGPVFERAFVNWVGVLVEEPA